MKASEKKASEKKPSSAKKAKAEKGSKKSVKVPEQSANEAQDLFPDEELAEDVVEEEEEVDEIELNGVTYLKSANNVVYNDNSDVVGSWNEKTQSIDFSEELEEGEIEELEEGEIEE